MFFPLQLEHARLKRLSRRIDEALALINHLRTYQGTHSWPKLSEEGLALVLTFEEKLPHYEYCIQEVWLKQLELRELYKQARAKLAEKVREGYKLRLGN